MNFRLESPASPRSPAEIAEELVAIVRALNQALDAWPNVGVVLDFNGTDMMVLLGDTAEEALERWEISRPQAPLAQAPRLAPSVPLPAGRRLASPRCGTCKHTEPHLTSAGQDNCTFVDVNGVQGCGCEHYAAAFDREAAEILFTDGAGWRAYKSGAPPVLLLWWNMGPPLPGKPR